MTSTDVTIGMICWFAIDVELPELKRSFKRRGVGLPWICLTHISAAAIGVLCPLLSVAIVIPGSVTCISGFIAGVRL